MGLGWLGWSQLGGLVGCLELVCFFRFGIKVLEFLDSCRLILETIPASKWLVTPIYKPFRPFGRGPTTLTTRSLGDTYDSPWLIATYPNWDDPPSSH